MRWHNITPIVPFKYGNNTVKCLAENGGCASQNTAIVTTTATKWSRNDLDTNPPWVAWDPWAWAWDPSAGGCPLPPPPLTPPCVDVCLASRAAMRLASCSSQRSNISTKLATSFSQWARDSNRRAFTCHNNNNNNNDKREVGVRRKGGCVKGGVWVCVRGGVLEEFHKILEGVNRCIMTHDCCCLIYLTLCLISFSFPM